MDGQQNDSVLIVKAKKNKKDYVSLYNKYSEKVFNYFWYRVGFNKSVAEDLTQDTFVRAFLSLDRYEDKGYSYGTYLTSIAHNLYVNYLKKPQTLEIEAAEEIPAEADMSLDRAFDAKLIWYAVQKMTSEQKNIVIMRYWLGMPIRQIASLIKKSDNAVKLILSRSRKILRQDTRLREAFESL